MNLVTCRECETEFNLENQWYYDNLCPSCKSDADGREKILPSCPLCRDRIEDEDGTTIQVTNPSMRGGRESLYVHEECGANHTPRHP